MTANTTLPSQRESLRQLLYHHHPKDPKEQDYHARMLALVETYADPCSRHRFEPGHFTASAFVLSPDQSSLLLIYHSKLRRWLQPGGHIDPQDTDVLQSAYREVLEETGISDMMLQHPGIFDIDIHAIPAFRQEPAHEHFDVRFLFRTSTLVFHAGSDAKEARWVPLDHVNAIESDHSVMRAVAKMQGKEVNW